MEDKSISPHKLQLDNRQKAALTGVRDVTSFDDKEILLQTKAGNMSIKGQNLSITRLDLERGLVDITGKVDTILYTKDGNTQAKKGKNILKRLFK